jgi:acetyl esterase/lipase
LGPWLIGGYSDIVRQRGRVSPRSVRLTLQRGLTMPASMTRMAVVALAISSAGVAAAQQAAPTLPENIRVELDVPYAATDNPRQRLDLYLPKGAATDAKLPLVVFIHGGGWQGGDKRAGLMLLPLVQSQQYALASVGYRLTGEAIWPAQIHDCKAAIRWLRANAVTYGIDPTRIGVAGSSAGGHLVCLLGTTGGVDALEGTIGEHDDVDSRVLCVVNQFGPTDFLDIDGANEAAKGMVAKLLGGRPADVPDVARAASPLAHVTKDDAPTICIHGTADQLVPYSQSTKLNRAYEEAGVECLMLTIPDGGHGGFRNPEVNVRTLQFLDKHLRGKPATISEEPIPAAPAK